MKIFVAIKRVADYRAHIPIRKDGEGIDLTGIKMSLNPFDAVAVEEAVRLKEQGIASEIVVVSIGDSATEETLREALARGADRGIHVETILETQPLGVAKTLKILIERENPQLVILGQQAIDDDFNQTGQMVSALLGWPQGAFISSLKIKDNEIEVVRDRDDGLETLRMPLPAVITATLRLHEPRYPTVPNIMKAGQKPIDVLTPEDLGVDLKPHLHTLHISEPPPRKPGIKVETVNELLEKLHTEAKVI